MGDTRELNALLPPIRISNNLQELLREVQDDRLKNSIQIDPKTFETNGSQKAGQPELSHPGPPQDTSNRQALPPLPEVERTVLGPNPWIRSVSDSTADIRRPNLKERSTSSAAGEGLRAKSSDGNCSLHKGNITQLGAIEVRYTESGQAQVRTQWLGSGIALSPLNAKEGNAPQKMITPSTDWTTVDLSKFKVEYGTRVPNSDGKGFSLDKPKSLNLERTLLPTVQLYDLANEKYILLPPAGQKVTLGQTEGSGIISVKEGLIADKHLHVEQKADGLYIKPLDAKGIFGQLQLASTWIETRDNVGSFRQIGVNEEVKVNPGDRIFLGSPSAKDGRRILEVSPLKTASGSSAAASHEVLIIPPIDSVLSGSGSEKAELNSNAILNRVVTDGEAEGKVIKTANNGQTLIVKLNEPAASNSQQLGEKLDKMTRGLVNSAQSDDLKDGKPNPEKYKAFDQVTTSGPKLYVTKENKVVEVIVKKVDGKNQAQIREYPNLRAIDKNKVTCSLQDEMVQKNLTYLKEHFENQKKLDDKVHKQENHFRKIHDHERKERVPDQVLNKSINEAIQGFHEAQGTSSSATKRTVFEFNSNATVNIEERFFVVENGHESAVEQRDGKFFEKHNPETAVDREKVHRKVVLHRDLISDNPGQVALLTYMEADASNYKLSGRTQPTESQRHARMDKISTNAALQLGPEVLSSSECREFEGFLRRHNQQLTKDLDALAASKESKISPEIKEKAKVLSEHLKADPIGETLNTSHYLLETKEGEVIAKYLQEFKPLSQEEREQVSKRVYDYGRRLLDNSKETQDKLLAKRLAAQGKVLQESYRLFLENNDLREMTRVVRTDPTKPEEHGKNFHRLSKVSRFVGPLALFAGWSQ